MVDPAAAQIADENVEPREAMRTRENSRWFSDRSRDSAWRMERVEEVVVGPKG